MFKYKYLHLNFWENFLGGHITLGRLIIYGENAMHWGVTFWTSRWGYICFRLPLRCFGRWWPLYFYLSPNATPWASTFYRGTRNDYRLESVLRRRKYGHNFNTKLLQQET